MKKRYITSFDLLRVMGMFMIFIHHTWAFLPFSLPDFGGRGVELFLVLSGFVTYYSCSDRDISLSLSGIIGFVAGKMARFYPLHLLTLGCMVFLPGDQPKILPDIAANTLLLHSWFPSEDIYWGGNGVSWFLSSLMFCYLCFPWINRCIQKINDLASAMVSMAGILLLTDLLYVICGRWNAGSTGYLFYIFPPYTAVIFGLGCLAGRLYELAGRWKTESYTAAAALILWMSVIFICGNSWDKFFYILFDLGMIVLFAGCKEHKIWSGNCVLAYLSSISFEFYLIHHVVIRYYGVYQGLFFHGKQVHFLLHEFLMLLASIFLSVVWHEIVRITRRCMRTGRKKP